MNNINTKQILIYAGIAIVCVIIIGVAVYFQFFFDKNKPVTTTGLESTEKQQEQEIEQIKTEFNLTFNNSVRRVQGESEDVQKVDETKDIVYSKYEIDLYSKDRYDINLNLPVINIKSDVADEINKEIDNTFGKKFNSVIQSKDVLSIYNLDYVAYLKDDILSLVIKATLKELDYPQRVMMKTYNYNIKTNQKVSLGTMIAKKGLDKNKVYEKITSEIQEVVDKNAKLAEAGYVLFKRDVSDKMYLPENIDTYFMDSNDHLYLIFAYGNSKFTSEMDVVIF